MHQSIDDDAASIDDDASKYRQRCIKVSRTMHQSIGNDASKYRQRCSGHRRLTFKASTAMVGCSIEFAQSIGNDGSDMVIDTSKYRQRWFRHRYRCFRHRHRWFRHRHRYFKVSATMVRTKGIDTSKYRQRYFGPWESILQSIGNGTLDHGNRYFKVSATVV